MTAIPVTVVTQNATHDDLTDSDYAVAFGVTLEYNNYVSPRQLFSGFLFAYNLCVCRQRSAYVQANAGSRCCCLWRDTDVCRPLSLLGG